MASSFGQGCSSPVSFVAEALVAWDRLQGGFFTQCLTEDKESTRFQALVSDDVIRKNQKGFGC